jgi:hypothetical protein
MRSGMSNVYVNRRLFRSYEPFLCKEAVKIGAAVPVGWKLNRRLFNRAAKPFLEKSKWIMHGDGRLPYFSWWTNMPVQFCVWSWRLLRRVSGFHRSNQGSWTDWKLLFINPAWESTMATLCDTPVLDDLMKPGAGFAQLMIGNELTDAQRLNLAQLCQVLSSASSTADSAVSGSTDCCEGGGCRP